MRAIILAGGKGARLKPYTTVLPKPLMPLNGELPIIEIILQQLKRNGFSRITLAVGYLSEIIMAFCGNGSKWGLTIDYSIEKSPLSTIAPLTLIHDLPDNFLVMNGDILTDLRYRDLYEFHVKSESDATIATYKRSVAIDFGVLEFSGNRVTGFREKPFYHFDVSMGVYCINRRIINKIERDKPYGFDNLMMDGINKDYNLSVYPFSGYWLDIGRPEDYDLANEQFSSIKGKLLI